MKPLLLLVLVHFCLCAQLGSTQENNSTTNSTLHPTVTPTKNIKPNSTSATTIPRIATTTTHTRSVPSDVTATTIKTMVTTTPMNTTASKIKPTSPARNGTMLPSTPVTVTPKAVAPQAAPSGFSAGSFIGGIVLTLGLLAIGYIGCRAYHAKRGVQYRTIDEHDAII
ncbi:porimin [Varanus komodoensis]|uniref:Transmembrane protein 123 n=1 Tax=Varanus komodoensis TaxID=61221 RepID=A0A8D2JHB5_VARKO|nr:porimin [Varanus komodoensis]